MISVDGLWAGYKPRQPVVRNVSFSVAPGEALTIVGPNGAGKSTVLKCLAGLLKPTRGTVTIWGRNVTSTPLNELSRIIGYVTPEIKAPSLLTVLEFVMMGRLVSRNTWRVRSEDVEAAYQALASLGIEHLAERYMDQLSTGQKQLVAIAQALAKKPRALLLDEPTSSLDLRHQYDVMDMIISLTREEKLTTVFIHHDLNLAIEYSDKVLVLNNGEVKAYGPTEEVLTEKLVEEVYKVKVKLVSINGALRIIPARRRREVGLMQG